jgi:predicted GIY-YIG superfamily endonuclease
VVRQAHHAEQRRSASRRAVAVSWFVYIAECADQSLYTGMTNDVNRRIEEHNSGHGGRYTGLLRPLKLLWKEEQLTQEAAAKREMQIKGWTRRKKLALISGNLALLKRL